MIERNVGDGAVRSSDGREVRQPSHSKLQQNFKKLAENYMNTNGKNMAKLVGQR